MKFDLPSLSSQSGVLGDSFSPTFHLTRAGNTKAILRTGLLPGGISYGVLPPWEESWFAVFYADVRPAFVALTPERATHYNWRDIENETVELVMLELDVEGMRLLPDIPTLHLPPQGDDDMTPCAVLVEAGILWQGATDYEHIGRPDLTPVPLRPHLDQSGIISYERLFNDPDIAAATISITGTAAVTEAIAPRRIHLRD